MMAAAVVLALVIMHSFGSASCTQGQSGDQPPPAGATAFAKMGPAQRATFLASWPTFEYRLSLTPDPTPELHFAPGETRTYYPQWEMYLTDAQATMLPQMTREPWMVIYPPEPPAATPVGVGGLTALSGC
jgi:hypothetical protein